MNILTIIADTFRECMGKKILIAFFGISTLGIIGLQFVFDVDIQGSQAAISAFFGHDSSLIRLSQLQEGVVKVEAAIAAGLYTVGIFLSLFATADIIPSILTRGRIELYLARPVSRASLLLGKCAGAVSFLALNIMYALTGIWVVLGIKTGVWNVSFFYAVGAILFMSFVLYTIMVFISIYARNTVVTIIILYFIVFLTPILAHRESMVFIKNETFKYILDGLYWIIPKYAEVAEITIKLVAGRPIESWTPVASSLLTAVIVLNISVYLFAKRDL